MRHRNIWRQKLNQQEHMHVNILKVFIISPSAFKNQDLQLCSSQKILHFQASILKLVQLILIGIEKISREWQELMKLACQLGCRPACISATITAESQTF